MREDKDRSTKWMLDHHGDSVLRLSGASGFLTWRSVRSELTHPRQMPDGLLEATFPGQAEPALYVVEVATYPERRAEEEAARNAMLVFLERGLVPEVLTVVLRPRGNLRVTGDWQLASGSGRTRLAVRSVVVEMWTQSAEALLAAGDVGLVPWATLADTTEPPEVLLRLCRERIDQAPPEERANLAAVAQVMAGLRYNDPSLLSILGGRQAMIESPVLIELLDEARREALQKAILRLLAKRFGPLPEALATQVRTVQALDRLETLIEHSAECPDLDTFRAHLAT
jgi:predicted transposase YdaD